MAKKQAEAAKKTRAPVSDDLEQLKRAVLECDRGLLVSRASRASAAFDAYDRALGKILAVIADAQADWERENENRVFRKRVRELSAIVNRLPAMLRNAETNAANLIPGESADIRRQVIGRVRRAVETAIEEGGSDGR